jgi:hypothetical protein
LWCCVAQLINIAPVCGRTFDKPEKPFGFRLALVRDDFLKKLFRADVRAIATRSTHFRTIINGRYRSVRNGVKANRVKHITCRDVWSADM